VTRLSTDELDDVRARNSIVDVASGYTKLRRSGGKLLGPCPTCGGKITSGRFEVFEKDQSWACYAFCNTGGDVISLVQHVEGCDFRAAIERLGGQRAVDPAQANAMFEARETKRLAREKTADSFREAERKRLWKTWEGAVRELAGTPVEAYAAGRGLQLPARCPGTRQAVLLLNLRNVRQRQPKNSRPRRLRLRHRKRRVRADAVKTGRKTEGDLLECDSPLLWLGAVHKSNAR
jgi:hypothetical protein